MSNYCDFKTNCVGRKEDLVLLVSILDKSDKDYTFCSRLTLNNVYFFVENDRLHRVEITGLIEHNVMGSLVNSASEIKSMIKKQPEGYLANWYLDQGKRIVELEDFLKNHQIEMEACVEDPINNFSERYYFNGNNEYKDYVRGDCMEFDVDHVLDSLRLIGHENLSRADSLRLIAADEKIRRKVFQNLGISDVLLQCDDFKNCEWNDQINNECDWIRFREFPIGYNIL